MPRCYTCGKDALLQKIMDKDLCEECIELHNEATPKALNFYPVDACLEELE